MLVFIKALGPVIELSTWLSAAKCITPVIVYLSNKLLINVSSQMSPWINV